MEYTSITYVNKNEIKKLYFDEPRQVDYSCNINDDSVIFGIAYCSEVISEEDGSVIPLEDVEFLICYNYWSSMNNN